MNRKTFKNINVLKDVFNKLLCIFIIALICLMESTMVLAKENTEEEMIRSFKSQTRQYIVSNTCTNKSAFLTFDDGPSIKNTTAILNILNQNNIKATFFVVGREAEKNPQIVKKLDNNGMCILPHTYSHDYKVMYKNVDEYFKDFEKCNNVIEKITGNKSKPYTRLPGGSDNLVCNEKNLRTIRNRLNAKGIDYVDWNVSSGDATSNSVPTSTIKNNIMSQCKNSKIAVVLMHDGALKNTTVEALPETINNLKQSGFTFKTFDEITPAQRAAMIKSRVINRK